MFANREPPAQQGGGRKRRARAVDDGPVRRLLLIALIGVTAGLACGSASAKSKPPRYEVAGLQVALYRYGEYKGPIDGIPGPMTKHAIRSFQRHAHLEP